MTYCHKCVHGFENQCANVNKNCYDCEWFNHDLLECKCNTVENPNECPYYEEVHNEEDS